MEAEGKRRCFAKRTESYTQKYQLWQSNPAAVKTKTKIGVDLKYIGHRCYYPLKPIQPKYLLIPFSAINRNFLQVCGLNFPFLPKLAHPLATFLPPSTLHDQIILEIGELTQYFTLPTCLSLVSAAYPSFISLKQAFHKTF